MPVPTLLQLAKRACIANIRHIDDVSDIPYQLVRPVLLKVQSPEQLRRIEENCPQIAGADAEIWRMFIKRDIPNSEKNPIEPKNPKNWWKVYRKLTREADEEVKGHEAALKAALTEKKVEKESHRITIVDKVMSQKKPKPQPQSRFTARGGDSSILSFRSGTRTKADTGKGLIEKVRREAREATLMHRGALATPTHQLAGKPGVGQARQSQSAGGTTSLQQKSTAVPLKAPPSAVNEKSSSPANSQRIVGIKRLPPSTNIFMPPKKKTRI